MFIAIDPGLSTGMAFRFNNGQWGTVTIPNMPDPNERLGLVLGTVVDQLMPGKDRCEAIIVEAFITMGYLSRYGIETLELVGALKSVCYLWSIPFVKQVPGIRMGMEPTAKKMLKARETQFTDHEVSALSHLLSYERTLLRHKELPPATPVPPAIEAGRAKVTIKQVP